MQQCSEYTHEMPTNYIDTEFTRDIDDMKNVCLVLIQSMRFPDGICNFYHVEEGKLCTPFIHELILYPSTFLCVGVDSMGGNGIVCSRCCYEFRSVETMQS